MKTYHKIYNVFKRNPETHKLIYGDWMRKEFEYLKNNTWTFTEKVDGTNIRILWNECLPVDPDIDESLYWTGDMEIRGKTDRAQLHGDLIKNINKLVTVDTLKYIFNDPYVSVCLYGEGYGAGIQKGGCYRPDKSFVLFDIKIGTWWLQRDDVEEVAASIGIDVVPIIKKGTLGDGIQMVKNGFKSRWGDFTAEGLVARPEIELKSRNGDRIITKIKHCDF